MDGHLYIAPGDITRLAADAIAFSASTHLSSGGTLYASFREHVPGFAAWYADLRSRHAPLSGVGGAFAMPLHADRRPYFVVVVASTGGPATDEDKAAIAVRAALSLAVKRLRAAGRTGRVLVALPAFRVGAGGDRRQQLRSAKVQVAAARDFLADDPGVDAAFITYNPSLYRVFLEARRQVAAASPDDPLRRPELEEALAAGQGVLFVGAGLSRGAGLLDWEGLIGRLSKDLGLPSGAKTDYLDLAQWYREVLGTDRLAGLLRETFGGPALPTLAHYLLLSLPVRHVITTNYDNLLEEALAAVNRPPVKVVRQEEVSRTGRGGVSVVKLHGDVERAEEIVLSRDDYDEFFQRRPAMALLLEGLLLNQTFFFVGYGLRDPNFRQIYSRIARMLPGARRPAFATTFGAAGAEGEHLVRQWKNKELHLLPVPGSNSEEQEHELLRFLDRLAERVTTRAPGLFLAPDVGVNPVLDPLRRLLVEDVGRALEDATELDLTAEDVRHVAGVLEFLTAQGWRPTRFGTGQLCRLWEMLALRATDAAERRRYLGFALAAAEGLSDVRHARELLDEADK
jgi:O-acetyl-ADP-ribose deacetylase (regulator of RNase III)